MNINSASTNSSEIIARYCDILIKKSVKSQASESEIDEKLSKIVNFSCFAIKFIIPFLDYIIQIYRRQGRISKVLFA